MGGLRPPRSPRGGGERTRDSDRPLDMQCAIIPNRCIRNKHSGPRAHLQTSDNMRLVFWSYEDAKGLREKERVDIPVPLQTNSRRSSEISHFTRKGFRGHYATGRESGRRPFRYQKQRKITRAAEATGQARRYNKTRNHPDLRTRSKRTSSSTAPRLRSKSGRMAPNITRRLNITL